MKNIDLRMRALIFDPRLAGLVAILGGVVYSIQSLLYTFTQISDVDEGAYLYQGYLFATGIYHPFQAGGPWTYNAPLSYFIWGVVQALFGPGIRTGRTFAIFLGVLMLVAVWITARRLGGKWWAAIAVWAVVLDLALIKLYSMAESQVLIACMLAWVLALAVGQNQQVWQVTTASVLAGLIVLTRHNLVLVLPILLAYIFWQHGRKAGLWSLAGGVLTVIVGHAVFWPGILVIWTPWLPAKLTPFLAAFRPPKEGSIAFPPNAFKQQVLAFSAGFRYQFTALAGSVAALIVWPRLSRWKNPFKFHTAVFLAVLFFSLLALHGWASLFNKFCIYCFNPYVAFFNVVGVLLVVAIFSEGLKQGSVVRQAIALVFVLMLFTGIGYGSFNLTGIWLLNLRIPRLRTLFMTGKLPEGFAVWDFLESKFHLDYQAARQIAPVIAGFILCLIFLLVTWFVWRSCLRNQGFAWMYFALMSILILGTLLSPIRVLSGGSREYDCAADNIRTNEQVGHYLARIISPGSKVYWDGGGSVVPLLYLPGARILPGQIYDFWSFSPDQDTEQVLKFGLWNQASAAQWKDQADFILIQAGRYGTEWDHFFHSNLLFEELGSSPVVNPCDGRSAILVFRRMP